MWNLATGECIKEVAGAASKPKLFGFAATPNGRKAITGCTDGSVNVWDLERETVLKTLHGHRNSVRAVSLTPDEKLAVTGAYDRTLRVWNLATGACVGVLTGHAQDVVAVALSADGTRVLSGSEDKTLRIWDLKQMRCIAVLEGHTDTVMGVAVTPDFRRAVSASKDRTIRAWDLQQGECISVLVGHDKAVYGIAIRDDGLRAVSAAIDSTVMVWSLPSYTDAGSPLENARYTNAKIVLVGKTHAGKTGLSLRLCENRWQPTESTHGMRVTKLPLSSAEGSRAEREAWLWDFAGQPDYRIIHQLYMDETAVALLVFDPQDDNPFEELGQWDKAIQVASRYSAAKFLVAARCDVGGITVSKKLFEDFCKTRGISQFLSTSAKTGRGCNALKSTIEESIPWDRLPWISTTRIFKTLKDAILKVADEDVPLVRLAELRQRLQLMLPEQEINPNKLRAVLGLMQGQGVIHVLGFGDFVLLQPEQINQYASTIVRMAREHVDEMGIVLEKAVLEGKLDYQDMKRLCKADEDILLHAIVQTLFDKSLCLREETASGAVLVFPSYFRRDKPDLPQHPDVFVTFKFSGPMDEIYTTLVVRLSYSGMFRKEQFWKDAADFQTPSGRRAGLAMKKKGEDKAEIIVYFDSGVADDLRVTFIKYVHEHLIDRAKDVVRQRTYFCPHCSSVVESLKSLEQRLASGKKDIICTGCEKRIPLIDLLEDKFASVELQRIVRELDDHASAI